MTLAALHLSLPDNTSTLSWRKRMHSVIRIKPVPAQIRARLLSNTIVQRAVPTNHREAIAAEAPPSSVISHPVRLPCALRGRIHLSPDCGKCAPRVPKLRRCLPNAPLSMTRRYPRRTHVRPRSRTSGTYLLGPLSSSLASRPFKATWPRSAPGSQRSPVYCGSTTLPEPSASISASGASDAERGDYRPPRRRPWA